MFSGPYICPSLSLFPRPSTSKPERRPKRSRSPEGHRGGTPSNGEVKNDSASAISPLRCYPTSSDLAAQTAGDQKMADSLTSSATALTMTYAQRHGHILGKPIASGDAELHTSTGIDSFRSSAQKTAISVKRPPPPKSHRAACHDSGAFSLAADVPPVGEHAGRSGRG